VIAGSPGCRSRGVGVKGRNVTCGSCGATRAIRDATFTSRPPRPRCGATAITISLGIASEVILRDDGGWSRPSGTARMHRGISAAVFG
jgi:hypothetical protein